MVPLSEVPLVMQKALIAIEDVRFYEHGGIDVKGTLRALLANGSSGQVSQGGSTLTQQYVKNVLIEDAHTKKQRAGGDRRHLQPQDPRGALCDRARAQAHQEPDPVPLPQHRLFRRRRVRRRDGRPALLQRAGVQARPCAERVAGRAGAVPGCLQPAAAPADGYGTTEHRPRPDAEVPLHRPVGLRRRSGIEDQAARPPAAERLHLVAVPVLLRLREARLRAHARARSRAAAPWRFDRADDALAEGTGRGRPRHPRLRPPQGAGQGGRCRGRRPARHRQGEGTRGQPDVRQQHQEGREHLRLRGRPQVRRQPWLPRRVDVQAVRPHRSAERGHPALDGHQVASHPEGLPRLPDLLGESLSYSPVGEQRRGQRSPARSTSRPAPGSP